MPSTWKHLLALALGSMMVLAACGDDDTNNNTAKEICNNVKDDDSDGKVDCADSDCTSDEACKVTSPETNCANDVDDDGDGKADCADTDCAAAANCIGGCATGETACGSDCCTADETCNNGVCQPQGGCATGEVECGDDCCTAGETCNNGVCEPVGTCATGTTACGDDCCTASETCNNGVCEPVGTCATGTTACGSDCCTATETCTNDVCIGGQTGTCMVASSYGTVSVSGEVRTGDGYLVVNGALPAADGTLDQVSVQLYSGMGVFANGIAVGEYDIANEELNFATCGLCVLMFGDATEEAIGSYYMATGGHVSLTDVNGVIVATATDLTFEHVEIDFAGQTYQSTPHADGCTSGIEDLAVNGHGPLTEDCNTVGDEDLDNAADCQDTDCYSDPDCLATCNANQTVCGPNCCNEGEFCTASYTCEVVSCSLDATMTSVTVAGPLKIGQMQNGDTYMTLQADIATSGTTVDRALVQVYEGMGAFASGFAPGSYTIAGDDANYATCGLCLLMLGDVDEAAETIGGVYFATAGSVEISSVSETGELVATASNLVFTHVDIDSQTYESTPNPDGCTSNVAAMSIQGLVEDCATTGDEDLDGAADCLDSDCASLPACLAAACSAASPMTGASVTDDSTTGTAVMSASCGYGARGNEKLFTINAGASGETGILTITANSADVDLVLHARTACDVTDSEVACVDRSSSGDEVITINDYAGGTDLTVIVDAYGAGEGGAFTLSYTFAVPECGNGTTEGAEQCDDGNQTAGDGCNACQLELSEVEVNNTLAQANAYVANFTGEITTDDVDWVSYQVTTPGTITVAITDGGTGACAANQMDSLLELWEANGTAAVADDDDGGDGRCSMMTYSVTAGTYYIMVQGYGSDDVFTYHLDVSVQ